jgi:hypothetical protein
MTDERGDVFIDFFGYLLFVPPVFEVFVYDRDHKWILREVLPSAG